MTDGDNEARQGLTDDSDDAAHLSFLTRQKARSEEATTKARGWFDLHREDTTVDLAVLLYERDRETFASVLGSAIAMRLFLFFIPVIVFVVGLANLIAGSARLGHLINSANVTGNVAKQIESSLNSTGGKGSWALVISGIFGSIWAGRSLTRVLAACSAGAWRMGGVGAKATLKMAATVTSLLFVAIIVSSVINRLRADSGIAVATGSVVLAGVVFALGWFVVTWTLPRSTTDPGALLPGAALFGVGMALLQWFMQFYLPNKISRSSSTMGSIGFAVAVLGYLFFIGRIMAASLILDAVLFEKLGSVSDVVFSLPVIRAIPRRWPKVRRFFDLPEPSDPKPDSESEATST
jgi:Virulence factor BrkB